MLVINSLKKIKEIGFSQETSTSPKVEAASRVFMTRGWGQNSLQEWAGFEEGSFVCGLMKLFFFN